MLTLSEAAYLQFLDALTTTQIVLSKLLIVLIILVLGLILAWIVYYIVAWILHKLRIQMYLGRLLGGETEMRIGKQDLATLVAKSIAIYVFLLIVRKAVMYLGFTEVEGFLTDLLNYLPSLFLAVLIAFFGIQFSRTIYMIVVQLFGFTDASTATVLGHVARILVLFLTFVVALQYARIISDFVINAVLIGVIAMLTLAGWIAFGLGGRSLAEQALLRLKHGGKNLMEEKKRSDDDIIL